MVVDSNPNPNYNSEHINSNSISKLPDAISSSQPHNLNFNSLLENPKLPFQGKGKEVALASSSSPPLVFHEFLQLKSESSEKFGLEEGEKKIQSEPLNIYFPLNVDPIRKFSLPQLPIIAEVTTLSAKVASSEDFSFSHSSHDSSCSLTKGSTQNNSIDQMWNTGEETVYGKFRTHGFTFSNYSNEVKKINSNKMDNELIYPVELPAITGQAVAAAPSLKNVTPSDGSFHLRSERLLKEIVCESVPVMKQVLQHLDSESLDELKDNLKRLMQDTGKKEKFLRLQKRLERRNDLTKETLARANRVQLEIMVAIKTAVADFLTIKGKVPNTLLVEIFMMTRCKNLNCKLLIPVDDCECEICTRGIGFCRECMCIVCTKFDCATNTCTWVRCWMCCHWCHALCALEKNLFKPGLDKKVGNGATEIQFMCPSCAHASEILGFVKDVFTTWGKTWGVQALMKELDCIRMIFHLSEDPEGKELEKKAIQILTKLDKQKITVADACEAMLKFFNYGVSDHSVTGTSSRNILPTLPNLLKSSNPIPATSLPETKIEPLKPMSTPILNHEEIQLLETNIRLKEAEVNFFQRLADEARKELESYVMILQATKEKMEEEHSSSFAEFYLKEGDVKKRKKFEEACKFAEGSHSGYKSMEGQYRHVAKMRKRVEAAKEWE